MKKNSKLQLNKETISALNNEEMDNLKGGFTWIFSAGDTCRYSREKINETKELSEEDMHKWDKERCQSEGREKQEGGVG